MKIRARNPFFLFISQLAWVFLVACASGTVKINDAFHNLQPPGVVENETTRSPYVEIGLLSESSSIGSSRVEGVAFGQDDVKVFSIKVVNKPAPKKLPAKIKWPQLRSEQTIQAKNSAIAKMRRLPGHTQNTESREEVTRTSLPKKRDIRQPVTKPGKIAIQVNTVPVNTYIYVDDRFVGQSPLTVYVERNRDHVIQFVKEGFEEKLIVIESRRLLHVERWIVTEKLNVIK